jgi:hypothetical protein
VLFWQFFRKTDMVLFNPYPKLYTPSTPNNSNETHTFMCLGRTGQVGSAKTALKFIYKIEIGYYSYTIQCMGQFISFKSEINNPWFNPWFILLHTHLNVCATVEGRCLEYLVCITLELGRTIWCSRLVQNI